MLIAIPVSAHDTHLLSDSVAVMLHFGLLQNHSIRLLPSRSQTEASEEAASHLSAICNDVKVLPLQFEGDGRWPQSPNLHFAMAMEALRQDRNREPIFWKELDCDPVKLKWADILENEWRAGRVPFCGKIVQTPSRNERNEIVYEADDFMMMGCAVYPANIMEMPQIQVLFKSFYSMQNDQPWDVYMRGWMRTHGWKNTEMIGDRWNTINYRLEHGRMACDPGPTQFTSRDHSQTDVIAACVIHGCKDGSLARLILSGELGEGTTAIPKVPEESKETAPAASPLPQQYEQELKSLWSAHGELLARVAKLERRPPPAAPPKDVSRATPAEPPIARNIPEALANIPEPRTNGNKPEIETIRGMIAGGTMQIGKLALACGMDKEELRAIIGKPDSQIILVKGWAKLDT